MPKTGRSSIGLDIGSRYIKLVELKKTGTGIILNKVAVKEIPGDIDKGDNSAVFQIVSQMFSENNIKARDVNISAGGQLVFIRFVKLLQVKEDKLKQTMKFEAQNQIPFPLDEVAWDWSLLDRNKNATKKAVIVAIKKNIIEEMTARLKEIKLTTSLIDVSSIALYNCMVFNDDYDRSKLGALLDVGAKISNLVMFRKGNIWIRSFPIAAEKLEDAKDKGFEEFMGEIERSIEYYFMQSGEELQGEKKIEEMILAGGGSRLAGLESGLASRFGVKPKILDPLRKFNIPKDVFTGTGEENFKNQISVAVGLALRGMTRLKVEVNFLEDMMTQRSIVSQKNLYSRISIVTAALIMLSFSIFMRQDYSLKRMKLDKVDEMLDTYRTYEPKIKNIQNAEDILAEKIGILYQVASSRSIWLDVLNTISGILPKNLWITDLSAIVSLEKNGLGRLDLSGKAMSYQSVNDFVSSLKSSPSFKEVKPISSSIETDESTGEEIVKFSITMDVVMPEKG